MEKCKDGDIVVRINNGGANGRYGIRVGAIFKVIHSEINKSGRASYSKSCSVPEGRWRFATNAEKMAYVMGCTHINQQRVNSIDSFEIF